MEALKEVLEFRTGRRIEAREFLARINRSVPPGIRFFGLEPAGESDPSLYKLTVGLVYSIDRTNAALGPPRSARELKLALERFNAGRSGAAAIFRFLGRRLVLVLPPAPEKGARAQDIVREVFGVDDPVFLIRRDKVALASLRSGT